MESETDSTTFFPASSVGAAHKARASVHAAPTFCATDGVKSEGKEKMPNRWLRDSILTSRTLAELSDFGERLFFRLLVVSDDFGRFNSDPAIGVRQVRC